MSRARDLSKLGNPNVIKADENSVGFGTQVAGNHANADSSLISAGIITATAYYGDGSNLEGVASAGLGTAVDDTKDSIGQNIYFTNAELSINENTTVNAPDTSSIAYTQYQQVTVESGSELIIADGDSFIPDVLGIGTALQASTAGAGNGLFGTVYTDNIENVAGRGGPNFPLGITVAGVSTLGGNVSIGGTLTYEDVTNVDSIGVVTARSGIDITGGNLNAASNLILKVDGTEKARVTSAGNFGIGDPNPTKRLTVQAGSNNADIALFTGNDLNRGLLISTVAANSQNDMGVVYHAQGQHSGSYLGEHIFKTNNAERLRISKDGAIGLAGANYGTSGQVLTSGGAGAAVQWATPAGGSWEVLTTTDFATTPANASISRGWTTNYQSVKLVYSYLRPASGLSNCSVRFYMDTSYGNNGTEGTTANEYHYGVSSKDWNSGAFNNGGNGNSTRWKLYNGGQAQWWSGEITFRIGTGLPNYTYAKSAQGWTELNNAYGSDSCKYDTEKDKVIVGAKIYEDGGSNFTQGRATWYGIKHS